MLLEKIKGDQKQHRKMAREDANSKIAASVLTTLLGELEGIAKRGKAVDDALVMATITKFLKGINESQLAAVQSVDFDRFNTEIVTLKEYMPEVMSEDELIKTIHSIVGEFAGSGEAYSMGQVMQRLKTYHSGQYDGKLASKLVREALECQK